MFTARFTLFTMRRIRLIALAALASLVFAQAAVAAMGCAMLRADAAQGNVALMPSGEPCDMMAGTPAPLMLKQCAQSAEAALGGEAAALHVLDAAALLPPLRIDAAAIAPVTRDHAQHTARILGPPPFALTRRLRI